MGSRKVKSGLLAILSVLIVLTFAANPPVSALIINQYNSTDDNYGIAFNVSVIPASSSTAVCSPVCTNYTVNVTLERDLPADGKIMIDFVKDYFDVSGATVVDVVSSVPFGGWTFTVDPVEDDIWVIRNATTPLPNGTWIRINISGVCNPTIAQTYVPGVVTTTSGNTYIEQNYSVNVTIVPAQPSKFLVWYWNATANKIEPLIPNNLTVSCPDALNPLPINISVVDACGNLNTTASYFVNITEYYSGTDLGNGTVSGGWLNTSVNISDTGWNRIVVENASTGITGQSNDFWLDPTVLGSFKWETIYSPQYIMYPFEVKVEAYDKCDNFKYDYNGSDYLSVPWGASISPSKANFTNGVFNDYVTITNSSLCPMLPLTFNITVTNNSVAPPISATSNDFELTRIAVNETLSEVTVEPTEVPADETSYATITATVRDDDGALLKNVKVRVSSDRGDTDFFTNSTGRYFGEAEDYTDSSGVVSFKVSSHTVGTANITVEVWDGCDWVEIAVVQVTFTSQVANPGTSLIYVWNGSAWVKSADNGLLANDEDYYIVKVVARDNEGNPVENVNVTLFPNSTNVRVEPASNLTDANGTATFKVYSKEWGWFKINATVNGQLIWEGPVEVFFNPVVVVDVLGWYGLGCKDRVPADGISAGVVVVEVEDLSGKDVPNAYVELSSNKSADSFINTPVLTDPYGYAHILVTSTNANPSNFTAHAYTTLDYWSATSANSSYEVFDMWKSNVTDPNNSTVWANKYDVEIDTDYAIVYVEIRDAYNNTVSNVNVTLVSSRPDYDKITPAYDYTNCSGVASFMVRSIKAGTSTFTAYVGDVEVGSVNITFYAPYCNYYVNTWYATDYLINLEEENTTTVYMQILYGEYFINDTDQSGSPGDVLTYVIELPYAPTSEVTLEIRAYDVDYDAGERDLVTVNGVPIGNLTGFDGQWSITRFTIPPGVLVSGKNYVNITVDVTGGGWVVDIDYVKVVIGSTPVPDQVVKIESLSNCGDNIVDVITPSNPVTNETGWIVFNVTTSMAQRPYYEEGSSCVPTGEDNEIRLVVKIGECYIYNYTNPLEVATVIDHGPKEKPTLELYCGASETDYPWAHEFYVEAPYYVTSDYQFHLKEFKLLLKNGTSYSIVAPSIEASTGSRDTGEDITIYYEDFETSNGDWYAEGAISTWEWGEPLEDSAQWLAWSNGQDKGWATGLGNNYNPAESSCLYSKPIDISGIAGDIAASMSYVAIFEPDDSWSIEYSIDGGEWNSYHLGDPIEVYNNTTIQFRICIETDGDTDADDGIYIDWFRVYQIVEPVTYYYGYAIISPWWYMEPEDEEAYDFVVKAVYCKNTPNGEYCLEAPLSDVLTIKIDTQGPKIELAKPTFNCSEAPYGYFDDFLGVDLTNDDFYVNLEGFSASYDYFFTLPYDSDWSKITWDNKYINVHFDHISLSGGDYILLWSGDAEWTGGTDNRPIEESSDVPVANITYNHWYEFPYKFYDFYSVEDKWNEYFGSVHGDLWFKFPVSRDEVCWLSYEHNGYIFYYDAYPPNDGFNVDMITYGTGVKIYLWDDAMNGWKDITDECNITADGFTLPMLEPGTYRLLIVATDVVGNANHLETTFTVKQCEARFVCGDLNVTPTTLVEGENITVTATITNVGELASNYTAGLYIDDSLVQTKSSPAEIAPGESWEVSFVQTMPEPGVYYVTVDTCPAVPVTVLSKANISVDYTVEPTSLCVGGDITVNVTVTNTGEQGVDYTLNLVVDGVVVDSTTVYVPGLDSVNVQFTYTMEEEGVHTVTVNDLDPTEVRVIGPGITISNLQVNPVAGDAPLNITVSADITNLGICNVSVNYTADLKVNGQIVDYKVVQLDVGETETVVFEYVLEEPGVYLVTIDGLEGVEVNVTAPPSPGDADNDGWNDTVEELIAYYNPDFDPADVPTADDVVNAVVGAVSKYFAPETTDEEKEQIVSDVIILVQEYFEHF